MPYYGHGVPHYRTLCAQLQVIVCLITGHCVANYLDIAELPRFEKISMCEIFESEMSSLISITVEEKTHLATKLSLT